MTFHYLFKHFEPNYLFVKIILIYMTFLKFFQKYNFTQIQT